MHLAIVERYKGPAWVVGIGVWLCLGISAGLFYSISNSTALHDLGAAKLFGTLVMLVSLPAYFSVCFIYLFRETRALPTLLGDASPAAFQKQLLHRVTHLHPTFIPILISAITFGAYQNVHIIQMMLAGHDFLVMDVAIVMGNCILWAFVGLLMGWRIPVSIELLRYGRGLKIDLYRAEHSHPLANLAAKDVLMVAGAMSFMPLQSLDAEFRWVNYAAGLYVGIPSALILLFLPLLGLRKNIEEHKVQRLAEIHAQITHTDHADITSLELLSAHSDRIKESSSWPFNMRLATKIIGYAIIAPLAWVGAALVENLVDNLAG